LIGLLAECLFVRSSWHSLFVGVTHAGETISGKPRVFADDTLANRQTKIRIEEIDV
jgi:hypothetical protein